MSVGSNPSQSGMAGDGGASRVAATESARVEPRGRGRSGTLAADLAQSDQ